MVAGDMMLVGDMTLEGDMTAVAGMTVVAGTAGGGEPATGRIGCANANLPRDARIRASKQRPRCGTCEERAAIVEVLAGEARK